ncbi:uncharacterized protein HRG_08923 [Hirsutella rhossiliensis]|uniref:Uncharacterized protein n=1 Tax=Hirsutella rhossiliensis TaxID=111463 RepID=A0A9P8MRT9_9HYPO|nr:uncharacterized protein HRG_08923 [Hirsutella rhossiliensis]KAH0959902.1 hypothetical protein HRG_08923 [Hirsutella rhossiliensis]
MKGIKFIRELDRIPLEFCDLLNELQMLRGVVNQVEGVLKDIEEQSLRANIDIAGMGIGASCLHSLKDDLGRIVVALGSLCERIKKPVEQLEPSNGREKSKVSRFRWHKEKDEIGRLRREARRIRETLDLPDQTGCRYPKHSLVVLSGIFGI